jgi:3-methyladenine DNA glycosylase Tag
MQGEWKRPEWWYIGKCPPNDNAYFENMSRVIFQAGLNWTVIDKKWPTTKKAFADFDIEKVSRFTNADVERLLKDKGIIRNRGKIAAIIQNAIMFSEIKKECDSFKKYLDGRDKNENYATVIKELTSRFKWMGPSSAGLFLYTVGEDIDPWKGYHH